MRPRSRASLLAASIAVATLALAAVAFARPGGGGSYSGGGGGGGGGGGYGGGGGGSDSGGDGLGFLVVMCFEHPVIGIPILLVVIALFVMKNMASRGPREWATAQARAAVVAAAPAVVRSQSVRKKLEWMRAVDENFSLIVFEDFLYALYAEIHTARGAGRIDRYSAYLSPMVAQQLGPTNLAAVNAIIVGAMRFVSEQGVGGGGDVRVGVEFEANYTEVDRAGRQQAYYVRERCELMRRGTARSRTPDRARLIGCPSCGAPLDMVYAGRCKHCGRDVTNGAFDWTVLSIMPLERQSRGPMLTGNTAEQGTDSPTIYDPEVRTRWAALTQKDPGFTSQAFEQRVWLVFSTFQQAWSARDLASMRPFLSDALFETQNYWVNAYLAQHLRNVTENARILRIEYARVESDKFYDALTIRLYATSLDYTLTDDGKVVSGSRSRERRYSEYWTFIRGAQTKRPTRSDRVCPNCGAPLAINMAGSCQYCKVKVTTGDFDWVLSRIEQDESYGG